MLGNVGLCMPRHAHHSTDIIFTRPTQQAIVVSTRVLRWGARSARCQSSSLRLLRPSNYIIIYHHSKLLTGPILQICISVVSCYAISADTLRWRQALCSSTPAAPQSTSLGAPPRCKYAFHLPQAMPCLRSADTVRLRQALCSSTPAAPQSTSSGAPPRCGRAATHPPRSCRHAYHGVKTHKTLAAFCGGAIGVEKCMVHSAPHSYMQCYSTA